jgi:mannose-1-phosphate guanylyltransferase/mannose-1-phosphate guanylyltransferase/mannose-6-phosphate isomerase
MYAVILAGGGGTRLWPLSRPEVPKPFLPLLGERTLLQLTYDRIVGHPELGLGPGYVAVVTDQRYRSLVAAQLPAAEILIEPIGRNTAAAIALATVGFDRPSDEVMLVLPADHDIRRADTFRAVLRAAARLAEGCFDIAAPLVTLGIRVDRPATEYGYLRPDLGRGADILGQPAYPLLAFEEKPTEARALELLRESGVAWNAGIFAWRRGAIRDALERHTGLISLLEPAVGSGALVATYDHLPSVSIDVAVMEGAASARQVAMTTMDAGWSDLGSWSSLLTAIGAAGTGRVVQAGEPVSAGPDDLVVERADGRLTLIEGPRSILASSPTALLSGAGGSRSQIEGLLERVARQEVRA